MSCSNASVDSERIADIDKQPNSAAEAVAEREGVEHEGQRNRKDRKSVEQDRRKAEDEEQANKVAREVVDNETRLNEIERNHIEQERTQVEILQQMNKVTKEGIENDKQKARKQTQQNRKDRKSVEQDGRNAEDEKQANKVAREAADTERRLNKEEENYIIKERKQVEILQQANKVAKETIENDRHENTKREQRNKTERQSVEQDRRKAEVEEQENKLARQAVDNDTRLNQEEGNSIEQVRTQVEILQQANKVEKEAIKQDSRRNQRVRNSLRKHKRPAGKETQAANDTRDPAQQTSPPEIKRQMGEGVLSVSYPEGEVLMSYRDQMFFADFTRKKSSGATGTRNEGAYKHDTIILHKREYDAAEQDSESVYMPEYLAEFVENNLGPVFLLGRDIELGSLTLFATLVAIYRSQVVLLLICADDLKDPLDPFYVNFALQVSKPLVLLAFGVTRDQLKEHCPVYLGLGELVFVNEPSSENKADWKGDLMHAIARAKEKDPSTIRLATPCSRRPDVIQRCCPSVSVDGRKRATGDHQHNLIKQRRGPEQDGTTVEKDNQTGTAVTDEKDQQDRKGDQNLIHCHLGYDQGRKDVEEGQTAEASAVHNSTASMPPIDHGIHKGARPKVRSSSHTMSPVRQDVIPDKPLEETEASEISDISESLRKVIGNGTAKSITEGRLLVNAVEETIANSCSLDKGERDRQANRKAVDIPLINTQEGGNVEKGKALQDQIYHPFRVNYERSKQPTEHAQLKNTKEDDDFETRNEEIRNGLQSLLYHKSSQMNELRNERTSEDALDITEAHAFRNERNITQLDDDQDIPLEENTRLIKTNVSAPRDVLSLPQEVSTIRMQTEKEFLYENGQPAGSMTVESDVEHEGDINYALKQNADQKGFQECTEVETEPRVSSELDRQLAERIVEAGEATSDAQDEMTGDEDHLLNRKSRSLERSPEDFVSTEDLPDVGQIVIPQEALQVDSPQRAVENDSPFAGSDTCLSTDAGQRRHMSSKGNQKVSGENMGIKDKKASGGESIGFENEDSADDENMCPCKGENDKTSALETDKPFEGGEDEEGNNLGSEELVKPGSTGGMDDSSVDPIKPPGMDRGTGLLKDMCDGSDDLGTRITSCDTNSDTPDPIVKV